MILDKAKVFSQVPSLLRLLFWFLESQAMSLFLVNAVCVDTKYQVVEENFFFPVEM